MCGVAGVVHGQEPVAVEAVRRMNDAQAHRGPDGVGIRSLRVGGRAVALGHRRLAIQDLSPAGQQPMENPATGDLIVYNGEIYNVAELRAELESHGVAMRSRSDTEVLLAAFARWGMGCLDRVFGMYAFVLYAARERALYAARDPMGIKPLYWARGGDGALVFASELRAVLASGLVDAQIDPLGLESVLAYGAVAAPRTMVAGVSLLAPATWMRIDLMDSAPGRMRAVKHWDWTAPPRREPVDAKVAASIRGALRESVASHLVSDVPVAVFLSSGIDSTAVAALAREARGTDIETFTVRLAEDAAMDEAPVARRTAERLGTRHHEVTLGERDALALATTWLTSIDQPSVDGLNTYIISRAARQRGIVVALSGLGGDEMFGGYSTFREVPLLAQAARVARHLPRGLFNRLAQRWSRGLATRAEKLDDLLDAEPTVAAVCLSRRRLMSNAQMEALGVGTHRRELFLPPECDIFRESVQHSAWACIRDVETRFYMGNMLLRDADVFGMAHGLEIRVPLLDRRVVEPALTYARGALQTPWSSAKPWLVGALDGRIPPDVLHRQKQGFSLPQAKWMRGPLREMFEGRIETLCSSGHVDAEGVRAVWRRFLSEPEGPAWSRAWLLGILGEWFDRLRGDGRARPHRAPEVATGT